VQGLSNAPENVQENEAPLHSAKTERPFPLASASGQMNPQSLCLAKARAWAGESRERAQTPTMGEKNMFKGASWRLCEDAGSPGDEG